jgi:hypothetical protein
MGRRFLTGDLVCKLQAPITQAPITPPAPATFALPPPAPPGVVRGEGAMGDGFSGRGHGIEPEAAAAPKRRRLDGQIFGAGQCGGAGRTIEVVTNFYGVRVNPHLRVVQYDVRLESGCGEEVKMAETRRHIVGEALLHLLAPPPVTGCAYDGKAILLVANGELTLTDEAAAAGWARTEHGQLVRSPPAVEPGRRGGARRFGGTPTIPPPWGPNSHLWVLETMRSAPARAPESRSRGIRPSPCVTSTARSAGEWRWTISATAGTAARKPL